MPHQRPNQPTRPGSPVPQPFVPPSPSLLFGSSGLFGRHIAGSFQEGEEARLAALLGRPGAGFNLRGGRVNLPELRQLLASGNLNRNNTQFLQGIINQATAARDAARAAAPPPGTLTLPPPQTGIRVPAPDDSNDLVFRSPDDPGRPPGGGGGGGGGGRGGGGDPGAGGGQPRLPGNLQDLFSGSPIRNITPFSEGVGGEIQGRLLELLNAPRREVDAFGGLRPQFESQIQSLLGSQGFAPDLLLALENRVRSNLKGRENEELQRRGDIFAGRNQFGSGPQVRSLEEVERGTRESLAESFTNIGLESARAGEQSRALGFQGLNALGQIGLGEETLESNDFFRGAQTGAQGLLGLGGLNLQGENIASQEMRDLIRSSIARELGLEDIDLRRDDLELQRQVQQLLINLEILSNFFGTGEGEGAGGLPPGLLDDLFDGTDFGIPNFERPRF